MRQRPCLPRLARLIAVTVALAAIAECAGPGRPLLESGSNSILERLQERKRLITSAAYRVRWRAKGTEPHGEFFLEIAYKAPDRFRISATGPFGIPAFTGVILGDKFWFVDHTRGLLTVDDLANLGKYQIPLSSFFSDYWRDLFAGGWGGTEAVTSLVSSAKHDVYEGQSRLSRWSITWDWRRSAPRRITLTEPDGQEPLVCDLRFGRFTTTAPYWQLDEVDFRAVRAGWLHRWNILKQDYNIEVPDRFFEPLQPPSKDKSRR
jgi:outer membrane lipoprotein-sorting protein